MCECVCDCVRERERKREREGGSGGRKGGRERERERERERIVCEKEWVNVCLLSIIISVMHNMDVHTRRELVIP